MFEVPREDLQMFELQIQNFATSKSLNLKNCWAPCSSLSVLGTSSDKQISTFKNLLGTRVRISARSARIFTKFSRNFADLQKFEFQIQSFAISQNFEFKLLLFSKILNFQRHQLQTKFCCAHAGAQNQRFRSPG